MAAVCLLLAQAEPAPVPPPPEPALPPPAAAEPDDTVTVSAFAGGSFHLATDGAQPWPSNGFSIGGTFEYRYWDRGPPERSRLLLGASFGFFHDRFADYLVDTTRDGVLTKTGFVLAQTAAVPLSIVTPWASAGGGFAIAYFSGMGQSSVMQPVLAGELGLDIALGSQVGIRLRLNLTHALARREHVTDSGTRVDLFGDLFDSDVGVFYRF
ncbi:MAG TPA: hypothetical protein VMU50_19330 [Polyangia bacterium]|nr:hypothetical protein [Polyangia bacterium]